MKNIATTVQHTSSMRSNRLGKGRTHNHDILQAARARLLLSHEYTIHFYIVFLTCSLSFAFSLLTVRCIFSQSYSFGVCTLAVADFNMYGYVCIFACNENLSLWLGLVWLTPKRPQKCVHFVQRTLTRICLYLSRSGYILLLLFILFPRRKSRMFHCTSERSYCHTEMNACMHILQYTLCVKFSVKLRSVTLFWDFVEMCVTFRINWIDELLMVCERRKISKWWIPWVIQYILRVINNRIHNTFNRVTSEIRRFFIEIAIPLSFYK